MKKIMNNKRADIPITVLVIGVVALCIYALLSFYLSATNVDRKISGTSVMEQINSKIEQYSFYKNTGEFADEELTNILGVQTDATGKKYIYAEQLDGNKKIIQVQYYLPKQ